MAGLEELTRQLSRATLSDGSETNITVSCWNINGTAGADHRKKVLKTTFQNQFDGTSLGQADIICIQEMIVDPKGIKAKEYLPFHDNYSVVDSKENGVFNALYYKKEKIQAVTNEPVNRAFHLLEIKRKIYDEIARKGDTEKHKAVKGELKPIDTASDEEKSMFQEVLEEVKNTTNSIQHFNNQIAKFKNPGDMETNSPEKLLRRRMAISCLGVKSLSDYIIVAISFHNYSGRSGKDAPRNGAALLFDFLKKLDCPVLIAGDFNYDATSEIQAANYGVENYRLEPLRKRRIDFIFLKQCICNANKFETSLCDTKAHDLQIPDSIQKKLDDEKKQVTNHNPLSATLKVKKIKTSV